MQESASDTIHSSPRSMGTINHSPPGEALQGTTRMTRFVRQNLSTLKKTASYYVVHISVAAMVAYAVTGDVLMSLTLSLLEPTVQAVAFFFHEKGWERINQRRALRDTEGAPA